MQQIINKKNLVILFLLAVFALLYFQLTVWQNAWLGSVLFVLFIMTVGYFWKEILKNSFGFNRKCFSVILLGWFASFVVLGLFSSIFIIFYKLTTSMIWWSYFTAGLIPSLLLLFSSRLKIKRKKIAVDKKESLLKSNLIWIFLYFVFWIVAFCLLLKSGSGEALMSPWQAIDKYYLPIFFVLNFLLGILLFSKFKIKGLLFLIVLHSILLHLYLPLSHQLPWGGDVWRHVAAEEQLLAGEFKPPVLFGSERIWVSLGMFDIPEVFVRPHKYAYGSLWGTSVVLAKTLQTDLVTINKWLLPIVWSIVFPVLLFYLGAILFRNWRQGLWLAGLSVLPFTWQALGSLTLPNSLGFLVFLLFLMLWLRYLQTGVKAQKWIVVVLAFLMVFGYSLYFLLIWFVIFSSWLFKHVSRIPYPVSRLAAKTALVFIGAFVIPAIELLSKISFVPWQIDWLGNLKQLLGQFSGWYYASQIRLHDILSSNILFNHTPDYAFVSSLFTDWRWFLIPLMAVIWFFVVIGLVRVKKIVWSTMVLLFSTVLGGYIIGWFVLDGDRLFTRRLDAVLAFLILIFFFYGVQHVSCIMYHVSKNTKKVFILISILILSWFGTTTYASGPDMRVISMDEYETGEYVWHNLAQDQENYCVLGDTWMLLALEGISSGKIIGGGFPIDYQFGQPERVVLFEEIKKEPRESVFRVAHEKTGSERCWLVLEDAQTPGISVEWLGEPIKIGSLNIWQEGLKNSDN